MSCQVDIQLSRDIQLSGEYAAVRLIYSCQEIYSFLSGSYMSGI
jgi:hypothetical protein